MTSYGFSYFGSIWSVLAGDSREFAAGLKGGNRGGQESKKELVYIFHRNEPDNVQPGGGFESDDVGIGFRYMHDGAAVLEPLFQLGGGNLGLLRPTWIL